MSGLLELQRVVGQLRQEGLDARSGLPRELFLLISSLTPVPNVDLLICNRENQVLLSWRNDEHYGPGWHIPGGCIRFGETMAQRLQKTALEELGCEVTWDPEPIAVRDVIRPPVATLENPDERGHNVTILYRCYLPEGFEIQNGDKTESEAGYLRWFTSIPDNLLRVHDVYRDVLDPWYD